MAGRVGAPERHGGGISPEIGLEDVLADKPKVPRAETLPETPNSMEVVPQGEDVSADDVVLRQAPREGSRMSAEHGCRVDNEPAARIGMLHMPDDEAGQTKKEALLAVYDRFAGVVTGWER